MTDSEPPVREKADQRRQPTGLPTGLNIVEYTHTHTQTLGTHKRTGAPSNKHIVGRSRMFLHTLCKISEPLVSTQLSPFIFADKQSD